MLIRVPAQSPDAVSGFFVVNATTPGGIDQAFATIVQHNAGAILYSAHQFFQVVRGQLVALAARAIGCRNALRVRRASAAPFPDRNGRPGSDVRFAHHVRL